MSQNNTKNKLMEHLIAVVEKLPTEQIAVVSQFAEELQDKVAKQKPARGSIEAIQQALNEFGHLQFEPGELENLLAEISAMRDLDVDKHE